VLRFLRQTLDRSVESRKSRRLSRVGALGRNSSVCSLAAGDSINRQNWTYEEHLLTSANEMLIRRRRYRTDMTVGPPPSGKGELLGVRIHPPQLAALNSWIAKQPDNPSRPESIRRLLDIALVHRSERSFKKAKGDRTIDKLRSAQAQQQICDQEQKPETLAPDEAFALMLETACEDFENLQDLVNKRIQIVPSQHEIFGSGEEERWTAVRANRALLRIQMALAKSFVFNARRANRICNLNKAVLKLDRLDRTRFLHATDPITAVRNVNEHGFDGESEITPSLHYQEGGLLDETALVIDGPQKILMEPLNLYTVFLAVDRMRGLAGFGALSKGRKRSGNA
jgi:hypothetical protein